MADYAMTVPDQALGNPIWFGSFQQKFESITGRPMTTEDVNKIIDNDEAFMRENKNAIERARNFADRKSIQQSATISSFLGKESFKGSAEGAQRDVARAANSFMRNFLSYEYETVTQAIQAGIKDGDMTKQEAVGILAGSLFRMSFYTAGTKGIIPQVIGYFFGDDEDEAVEDATFDEEKGLYFFENYADVPEDIRELKEVKATGSGYAVSEEDLNAWAESKSELTKQQMLRGIGQSILFGLKGGGGGLSDQLVSFALHQAVEEEYIASLLGTYDPETQTYKDYENSVNYSRLGTLVDKIAEGKEVDVASEIFGILAPQLGVSAERLETYASLESEIGRINSKLEEVDEDGNFVIKDEKKRKELEERRESLRQSRTDVILYSLSNYALQIPVFIDYVQKVVDDAQENLYGGGEVRYPAKEEEDKTYEPSLAPLNKKDIPNVINTVGNRTEAVKYMLDYKSPHHSSTTIQDEIIAFELYGLDAWSNTYGKNVFDPSKITTSSKDGPYANFINTEIGREELLLGIYSKLIEEDRIEEANGIAKIIARDY